MSLSKAAMPSLRRIVLAGALVALGSALGACSFSPVYGGAAASQPQLALAYAKPKTRLEQVIYQELALRLGATDAPTAPQASVVASASATAPAQSYTANPSLPQEVTVTASLTITHPDGRAPETFTRRATASYTRNSQVLADNAAATEAAERAAKAAAESLRLAVLASRSR